MRSGAQLLARAARTAASGCLISARHFILRPMVFISDRRRFWGILQHVLDERKLGKARVRSFSSDFSSYLDAIDRTLVIVSIFPFSS